MRLVWMSGPKEAVARGAYTNGPGPRTRIQAQMDDDDVLVGKDKHGKVIRALHGPNLDAYQGEVE